MSLYWFGCGVGFGMVVWCGFCFVGCVGVVGMVGFVGCWFVFIVGFGLYYFGVVLCVLGDGLC